MTIGFRYHFDLDRVASLDNADTLAFSLSVTSSLELAAIGPGSEAYARFANFNIPIESSLATYDAQVFNTALSPLFPWTWNRTSVSIVVSGSAGGSVAPTVIVADGAVNQADGDAQALRFALCRQMDQRSVSNSLAPNLFSVNALESWTYQYANGEPIAVSQEAASWPVLIASLLAHRAPLPRTVWGSVWLFRVQAQHLQQCTGDQLTAAVAFADFTNVTFAPAWDPAHKQWSYTVGGQASTVAGLCGPIARVVTPDPNPSALQWRQIDEMQSEMLPWLSRDGGWVDFARQVAPLFDVPAVLREELPVLDNAWNAVKIEDAIKLIQGRAVAVLRGIADLVELGAPRLLAAEPTDIATGVDGSDLLDISVARLEGVSTEAAKAFRVAVQDAAVSLDNGNALISLDNENAISYLANLKEAAAPLEHAFGDIRDLPNNSVVALVLDSYSGFLRCVRDLFGDKMAGAALVWNRWASIVKSLDAVAGADARRFWNDHGVALQAILAEIDVWDRMKVDRAAQMTRRLALANAENQQVPGAPLPKSATKVLPGRTQLLDILKQVGLKYLEWSFNGAFADAGERTRLEKILCAGLGPIEKRLLDSDADVVAGDGTTTDVPHALVFPLTAPRLDGIGPDEIDSLAGYGVLARWRDPNQPGNPEATGKWRCLNLSVLTLEKPSEHHPCGTPIGTPNIDPIPLKFAAGLAQGTLIYDNRPLLDHFDPAPPTLDSEEKAAMPVLVRALAVPSDMNDWAKLPPLAFGLDYQIAAFEIPSCGVLPASLRDADPTQIKAFDGNIAPGIVATRRYVRRVGIGLPNWNLVQESANGEAAWIGAKYAKDTPLLAFDRDVCLPMVRGDTGALPPVVVLLHPHPGENIDVKLKAFDLQVSRPVIGFEAFDRWCIKRQLLVPAANTETLARWKEMRQSYRAAQLHIEEKTDQARKADVPSADRLKVAKALGIEDPHVTAIVVELVSEVGATQRKLVALAIPAMPPATVGLDLLELASLTKAPPVNLHVEATTTGLRVTVGVTLDWQVPVGRVCELRVYPAVAEAVFDPALGEIHSKLAKDKPRQSDSGTNWVLFEPQRVRIEVANHFAYSDPELLPQHPASLYESAYLYESVMATEGAHAEREARLLMNPHVAGNEIDLARRRNIGWFEIGWQEWRWAGRPLPEFPMSALNPPVDKLKGWQTLGFIGRQGAPSDRIRVPVSPFTGRQVLYSAPLAHRPGEQMVRFTATALHRYTDVYLKNLKMTLPQVEASATGVGGKTRDRWLPVEVRGVWDKPVPVPLVKLVLPLTRAMDDGTENPASDLLVVVNEEWGQVGRLAETFEAAVKLAVRIGKSEGDSETSRLEQGRDPLVVKPQPATTGGFADPGPTALLPLMHVGPIGYTYDTDSSAPLFVAASFVLRAPMEVRPFDMMRLAFRRGLEPLGMHPDVPFSAANRTVRLIATDVGMYGQGAIRFDSNARFQEWTVIAAGHTLVFALTATGWSVTGATGSIATSDQAKSLWVNVTDNKLAIRTVLVRLGPVMKRDVDPIRKVGYRWELVVESRPVTAPGGVDVVSPWRRLLQYEFNVSDVNAEPPPEGCDLAVIIPAECAWRYATAFPRLSDYTPAFPVQWLPRSDRLGFFTTNAGTPSETDVETPSEQIVALSDITNMPVLMIEKRDAWTTLQLSKGRGARVFNPQFLRQPPLTAAFVEPGIERMFHLVLLTHEIAGADGSKSEVYDGIYSRDTQVPSTLNRLKDGMPMPAASLTQLRLRILLVQADPRFDGHFGNDVWEWFFPESANPDDMAKDKDAFLRVIAVSDPYRASA